MSDAKKTDPQLWEQVKDEITQSDKGGAPGQWSARKAQMAVQEYKRRGGGYAEEGPDQEDTDLHQWTEEEWGTKSGDQSEETGERYLPKKVRMLLTEDEYARSTQKKKEGEKQHIDQPGDVEDKVSRIKHDGPTRDMLVERARDLDIDGYSRMDKDDLLTAIDNATDEQGRGWGSRASLDAMTKGELMDMAQARDLEGRSQMSKDELVDALEESPSGQDLDDRSKAELYEMAQARDISGRSRMDKDELEAALQGS